MLKKIEYNRLDCLYVLDNLRIEDEIEASEQCGENWKEILFDSINQLPNTYIGITKDNVPVLIFGAQEVGHNIACVWLLSTKEIEKHKSSFFRQLKKEIKNFDKKYLLTYNFIYEKNFFAKNWLKKVGYRFPKEEKEPNEIDKKLLSIKCDKGFEIFYRRNEERLCV